MIHLCKFTEFCATRFERWDELKIRKLNVRCPRSTALSVIGLWNAVSMGQKSYRSNLRVLGLAAPRPPDLIVKSSR